jgi:magnesium transporter
MAVDMDAAIGQRAVGVKHQQPDTSGIARAMHGASVSRSAAVPFVIVSTADLSSPVMHAMHSVRTAVHAGATAEEARALLRERKLDHHLFYVYVVDGDDRLLGQVSARRLLLSHGDEPITELMHAAPAVVAFTDTVGRAFEYLATYRQLAIPVVDGDQRLLGVVDVTAWTADAADRLEGGRAEFFGRLGAAVEEHRLGGPIRGFQMRMPWLLCNIASGLGCAFIAEAHKELLETVIVLAAFIPLVLTVTESVGVQAAELSVGLLRSNASLAAFLRRLRTEAATSILLGVAAGGIVGLSTLIFTQPEERNRIILILLVSVIAAMMIAALIGSFVPRILRWLGADPKFASGPVTLMAVDVASTLTYLTVATAFFARHAPVVSP